MESAAIQRKLTTILVADVAGYSVLMGRVLIAVTRPSVTSIRTGPSPGREHVYGLAVDRGLTRFIDKGVQRVCRALQKTTQSFERDLLAGSQGQRRTAPDRAWWNPLERCLRCRIGAASLRSTEARRPMVSREGPAGS